MLLGSLGLLRCGLWEELFLFEYLIVYYRKLIGESNWFHAHINTQSALILLDLAFVCGLLNRLIRLLVMVNT